MKILLVLLGLSAVVYLFLEIRSRQESVKTFPTISSQLLGIVEREFIPGSTTFRHYDDQGHGVSYVGGTLDLGHGVSLSVQDWSGGGMGGVNIYVIGAKKWWRTEGENITLKMDSAQSTFFAVISKGGASLDAKAEPRMNVSFSISRDQFRQLLAQLVNSKTVIFDLADSDQVTVTHEQLEPLRALLAYEDKSGNDR
jgi:hypothetical protein